MSKSKSVSDLPLLRPKIGGSRSQGERAPSVGNLLKGHSQRGGGNGSGRGPHPGRWRAAAAAKQPPAFAQRVVIKARVVKMGGGGRKAAALHMRYIEREGVEQDGSAGQLYGKDQDFEREDFTREIEGEPHQFRFIVSPENGADLDLTQFTRELMRQVEKDLGRRVEWAAVNHYNTDNPHAHIVVRGVDLDGQELRLDRDYLSRGMRYRAQEIATRELGLRSEHDIEQTLNREMGQERLTSIDRKLAEVAPENRFHLGDYPEGQRGISQRRILGRLQTLERMGLAAQESPGNWRLEDGWTDSLKALGERGDIIKEVHRAMKQPPEHVHIVGADELEANTRIVGRLVRKGLADELYDKPYLMVETPDGRAHYLKGSRHDDFEHVREGEFVSVKVEHESWIKPADQNIADVAAHNGGIYSRSAHAAAIGRSHVKVNGMEVKTGDFLDAHESRLQRLARFKLVEQSADGAWRVPQDLVLQLQERDRKVPITRVKVDLDNKLSMNAQESYRGRTWLDRYTANPEQLARTGFGAEVAQSVARRVQQLRDLGIDPTDPSRARRLDRLEQSDLSQRAATRTGLTARQLAAGDSMIGRIAGIEETPSGNRFTRIDDPRGKAFSLVPWRPEHDKAMGQQAEVANEAGRVRARVMDRGIERGR